MARDGIVHGIYFGLDSATLQSMQTATVQCISDVKTVGQGHSFSGRSMTLASLESLQQDLMEINAALARANGSRIRRTRAYGGGRTR